MTRILLDGADYRPASDPSTWGDLLPAIDAECRATGRIVTDVRFDGIDEAAFSEPPALARPLAGCVLVEVTTGSSSGLIRRTLDEATAGLRELQAATGAFAQLFRARRIDDATLALGQLADGLSQFVGVVGAVALALQLDPARVHCGERTASQMIDALGARVEAIVGAHRREDWDTVARLLDEDLKPFLGEWEGVLLALGREVPS